MNNLQIFSNPDFGDIRAIEIDGDGWFVGRDIAIALGYQRPANAIRKHVDMEDTLKRGLLDSRGIEQQTIIINESGVYALIILSEIPSAKKFKRWVTHEVLPAIRKTGGYQLPQMSTNEIIAHIAQANVDLERRVDSIERKIEEAAVSQDDDVFSNFFFPDASRWKTDADNTIKLMVKTHQLNQTTFRAKLYRELEDLAGVNIDARLRNLRARMKKQGFTRREQLATTKLDAISKDKELRELFGDEILSKYMSRYEA